MQPTNFKKYLNEVVECYDDHYPNLRWGQVYLNTLQHYQPNMVLKILNDNNELDPYYNDDVIPQFLDYVQSHWGVYD